MYFNSMGVFYQLSRIKMLNIIRAYTTFKWKKYLERKKVYTNRKPKEMSTIFSLGWVNLSITWLFSTCSYRIKLSTRFWLNRDEISARFTVIKFWYVMVILFLHCSHLSCETESHYGLRIHWRLSTILKTSNKSGWSNAFWYVKVYIFWKFIRYNIHWDKTKMLKRFLPN